MMLISKLIRFFKRTIYFGNNCYCPVCKATIRQFHPFGVNLRRNAMCPVCGSVERHRMIWLYFNSETDLFSSQGKKMLHIAPEACFVDKLMNHSQIDYLTADLTNPAMVQMDLTDIQYPENSFDVIYCSHVLEHIPDDRKAMKELARILRPNGWAILQVPLSINQDKTFEDPSITDPKERERLFGQSDHVRVYGKDYKHRLEEAGFRVENIPYLEKFSTEEKHRFGLNIDKDDIYFCRLNSGN